MLKSTPARFKAVNGLVGPYYNIDATTTAQGMSTPFHESQHLTGLRREDMEKLYGLNSSGYSGVDAQGVPRDIPYALMNLSEAGPGLSDIHQRSFEDSSIPRTAAGLVDILRNGTAAQKAELASKLGMDGRRFMNMFDMSRGVYVPASLREGAGSLPLYRTMRSEGLSPAEDAGQGQAPRGRMPASNILLDLIKASYEISDNGSGLPRRQLA